MTEINSKQLNTIVEVEVQDYVRGHWHKAAGYFVADHNRQTYAVIVVPDVPRPFPARIVVMARVVDNHVIIDENTTDRPLYEELIRAGIKREQITCLYAGETPPQPAD